VNILVFTKNWVGDVIFEMPAIRVIKENYPAAHLIAVTTPRCVDILAANPDVDEVMTFDEKSTQKSVFSKLWFTSILRQRKIHQAYLFHRSSTRARIAYFSGAKMRVGYDTKGRGFWLTHAVPQPKEPMHDVHYFLNLLSAAGLRVGIDCHYEFFFKDDDAMHAQALLDAHALDPKRLVAINPSANWERKRWPTEYYKMLVRRLIKLYDVQIVITGTAEDQQVADQILDQSGELPIFSLCGKTTICQLGALLSKCQFLVSNDSGPLHIGTGVGTNVLGIFGPTAPRETAPLGRGKNILIHYAPPGMKLPWIGKHFPSPWMELITVDEVLKVIEREELLTKSVARCS
jgi:heptosyltransferase II